MSLGLWRKYFSGFSPLNFEGSCNVGSVVYKSVWRIPWGRTKDKRQCVRGAPLRRGVTSKHAESYSSCTKLEKTCVLFKKRYNKSNNIKCSVLRRVKTYRYNDNVCSRKACHSDVPRQDESIASKVWRNVNMLTHNKYTLSEHESRWTTFNLFVYCFVSSSSNYFPSSSSSDVLFVLSKDNMDNGHR